MAPKINAILKAKYFIAFFICTQLACKNQNGIKIVTVSEFKSFITASKYITDAENIGWSFVQINIDSFAIVEGANWKKPDGINSPKENLPVTQISYNDALAYTAWSNTKIPSYDEYWYLTKHDSRSVVINMTEIHPAKTVNIVGNTWEITQANRLGAIRLAGGSYLCAKNSCNGASPKTELYIDRFTGNSHIGLAILE